MRGDVMITSAKCPECGMENRITLDANEPWRQVLVHCDDEVGGCGQLFVVNATVTVTPHIFKLTLMDEKDFPEWKSPFEFEEEPS